MSLELFLAPCFSLVHYILCFSYSVSWQWIYVGKALRVTLKMATLCDRERLLFIDCSVWLRPSCVRIYSHWLHMMFVFSCIKITTMNLWLKISLQFSHSSSLHLNILWIYEHSFSVRSEPTDMKHMLILFSVHLEEQRKQTLHFSSGSVK